MGTRGVSSLRQPDSKRRRAWNRWSLGNLLVGVRPLAVGGLLAAVFLAGSTFLNYDPFSPLTRVGLKAVAVILAVAVAALWLLNPTWRLRAADVTAGAAGAFTALVLATALHGTPFPPGGLGRAAAFRTPAVARFTADWRNADFTYEGLPSFYPPLMTWVTGRAAAVLDLAPYHALKIASIAVAFLVPIMAYVLWRRVVAPPAAALISVAAVALPNVFQPDAWMALFVIVPWWLDAVYGIRRDGCRARPVLVQGLIGAPIFCLYYYYFFILGIGLLLAHLLDRLHPPQDARPWARRFGVLGVAAGVSSVFWLPLLVSMVRAAEPASLQNFWFTPDHVRFPLNFLEPSVLGAIMLAGFAHSVWSATRDRVSAGLALLIAAGYAWYLVGFVLAAVGSPVLVFRTEPFLNLVLVAGGVRAVVVAVRHACGRWPRPDVIRLTAVAAVAVTVFVAHSHIEALLTDRDLLSAHDQVLPNGRMPVSATHQAPMKAPTKKVIQTIRDLYTGVGEPVVLSTRRDILQTSTLYGFNQWRAIYAHPAGEFPARLDFTRKLAAASGPAQFAAMAQQNRFDTLDAFVLRPRPGDLLLYVVTDDNYPHMNAPARVMFNRSLFDEAHWRTVQLKETFIAVRREDA